MKTSARISAVTMLVVPLAACDAAPREVRVETADSAGIAIVTSYANDLPVGVSVQATRTVGEAGDAETLYQFYAANTAVDGSGNIYVLDRGANRVHVFDSTGARITAFGGRGSGPGELRFPLALAVSSTGIVRVADVGKHRFVQWNAKGTPLEEVDMLERYRGGAIGWTIAGMAITEFGAGFQRVVLMRDDRETMTLAEVTDLPRKALSLPSCGMSFTNMSPIFSPDLPWAAYGDRIVIARNPEYVLDEYVSGRHVRSIRRNIPPREATAELAKESLGDAFRVRVEGEERVCDPAEVVEQQGFAPHLPSIERIALSPDGHLWVQRYTVGKEPGPIDVFDAEGRYIGTIEDGSTFPIGFLPDGRLLVPEMDDMDVQRLVIRTVRFEP